ncbi:hypothetical protein JT063_04775 [Helicobacter pylori]|nr:hypothetical protein [Helicobacter pylori]
MALYSVLGFHFSHAIDESGLNKLVGKKVQEALAEEKAKAKNENEKFFIGYFIGAGLGGESVTANVLKDFGDILAQLAQFQGYGSLGLRMGDKHHTLELSASVHGDAPSCSLKKLKTCESARVLQAKIPRGIFESYVTWSADYVYRF